MTTWLQDDDYSVSQVRKNGGAERRGRKAEILRDTDPEWLTYPVGQNLAIGLIYLQRRLGNVVQQYSRQTRLLGHGGTHIFNIIR